MLNFAKRILEGDVRAISRTISMVECDVSTSSDILREIYPHCGKARIIGVTGSPGAGKSSLINQVTQKYLSLGHKVAILAVDPTSEFTGGGVLGDRIRMPILSDNLYIRSLGTRGHLGGLNRSCGDILMILDAAGYDTIIIETVGIGQSEIEIHNFADIVVFVTTPNQGDDIQSLKAGILEIGDIFVVNKADLPNVELTVADLEQMIHLYYRNPHQKTNHFNSCFESNFGSCVLPPPNTSEWSPKVLKVISTKGEGISELIKQIEEYWRIVSATGLFSQRRLHTQMLRLIDELTERWKNEVLINPCNKKIWEQIYHKMSDCYIDPWTASDLMWDKLSKTLD